MREDYPEILPVDDKAIRSWHEYFDRFNAEIYPKIFKPHGIDRDVAHVLWNINALRSDVQHLAYEDEDEGEEWQK